MEPTQELEMRKALQVNLEREGRDRPRRKKRQSPPNLKTPTAEDIGFRV